MCPASYVAYPDDMESHAHPTEQPATPADATTPVTEARRAQALWAEAGIRERLKVVRRLRRRMADRLDDLLDILQRGDRPRHEGLVAEIVPLADACRFLERQAATILRPHCASWRTRPAWLHGVSAEVRREPFGVILVVAPANYPLLLPGVQILQALVAGNAVVVKPALGCTGPLALLTALMEDAGLPRGLVRLLDETVGQVEAALDAGVDKVVLTGSATTGRCVAAAAAARLIPTTMELSGNDPVFVLPGADLDLVARALAFGLRFNGSATCIAPRRVFVARADAGALESALSARLLEVPAVRLTAETRAGLAGLVAQAIAAGARPLTGPPDLAGPEVPPIVLAEAAPGMALLQADVFAPVLAIVTVANVDEALAMATHSPYALGASVFGPPRAASALAARIDAGTVTINDLIVPTADPRLPFGGRRQSGWGVTRGAEGLLEMTRIKAVSTRRRGPHVHFDVPRPGGAALLDAAFRLLHGAGGTRRQAIGTLVRSLRRRGQRSDR